MFAGIGRVLSAPRLLAVVWLANLLVALPAAVLVVDGLRAAIGASEAGERLLAGFDFGWRGEVAAEAEGLLDTLEPGRLASGGWIDNLDGWWSGELFRQPAPILAFAGLHALVWLLLSGASLAHFHRPPRRFALAGFLADGAGFFFRFLRLALLAAPLYYGIFRFARWLFRRLERSTLEMTVERTVLIYYLLAAGLVILLLVTVKLAFDFAKVAMVVGERRSALLAALSGFAFVARRPWAVYGLAAFFGLAGVALLAVKELTAPGLGQRSLAAILGVFAVGQVFVAARLALRLGLMAGELALYEEDNR